MPTDQRAALAPYGSPLRPRDVDVHDLAIRLVTAARREAGDRGRCPLCEENADGLEALLNTMGLTIVPMEER